MSLTSEGYKTQQKKRVIYGFIWVIISAILWGASYVGYGMQDVVSGSLEWTFAGYGTAEIVASCAVVSAITSMMFALITFFVWCVPAGKAKDVIRTLVRPKIDGWMAFATIFGGILAVFGTVLATQGVGALLAGTASIVSIAVGAVVASVMNKEKMVRNTIIGIVIIIVAGVLMMDPMALMDSFSTMSDQATLGYVGILMCVIGWAMEGNIAVRVYDITDSDSTLAVKQILDTLIWFVILIPICGAIVGFDRVYGYMANVFTSPDMMLWLLVIGLVMVPCNASTSKAFPLIGVARVGSLNATYAVFSMIFLLVFMGVVPATVVLVGVILAMVGVYVMYRDSGTLVEGNRNVGGEGS